MSRVDTLRSSSSTTRVASAVEGSPFPAIRELRNGGCSNVENLVTLSKKFKLRKSVVFVTKIVSNYFYRY